MDVVAVEAEGVAAMVTVVVTEIEVATEVIFYHLINGNIMNFTNYI